MAAVHGFYGYPVYYYDGTREGMAGYAPCVHGARDRIAICPSDIPLCRSETYPSHSILAPSGKIERRSVLSALTFGLVAATAELLRGAHALCRERSMRPAEFMNIQKVVAVTLQPGKRIFPRYVTPPLCIDVFRVLVVIFIMKIALRVRTKILDRETFFFGQRESACFDNAGYCIVIT